MGKQKNISYFIFETEKFYSELRVKARVKVSIIRILIVKIFKIKIKTKEILFQKL